LTEYSVAFDETLEDYVLTLTGTNFGANETNTHFLIDDEEQLIVSANDTSIQVHITSMMSSSTRNIDFYLPIGLPDGLDALTLT
jgi:hypothetical protein